MAFLVVAVAVENDLNRLSFIKATKKRTGKESQTNKTKKKLSFESSQNAEYLAVLFECLLSHSRGLGTLLDSVREVLEGLQSTRARWAYETDTRDRKTQEAGRQTKRKKIRTAQRDIKSTEEIRLLDKTWNPSRVGWVSGLVLLMTYQCDVY